VAVVSAAGELTASYGNVQASSFLRSTAKPFQAMPLVIAGGLEHYGFTDRELALICASHSGTDEHVMVAESIQRKAGLTESQLLCGTHAPMHKKTADRLRSMRQELSPNRHNCSGKHSGMLAYAKMRGWKLDDYIDPNHPMQQEILTHFAEFADMSISDLAIGVDGCSAPNWAAPLFSTARAYAKLMDPSGLSSDQQLACGKICEAMIAHPDMVGGPDRFDTILMQASSGAILSKGGAEGYQGIGLRAGTLGSGSPAIGIAVKIADGDARGWVCHAVAIEVLRQLGTLSNDQLNQLADFGPRREVKNWRGLNVGQGVPIVKLEKPS
jgi:L-asparaginase II